MKMASVENLSDSELRRRLSQYGVNVGPVTETTRKIFVKKLQTLMTQSTKGSPKGRKSSGSLSRFSSGEDESDPDEKKTRGRLSMPPPKTPTVTHKRRSLDRNVTVEKPSYNERPSHNIVSSRPTSQKNVLDTPLSKTSFRYSYKTDSLDIDTGSDTDTPEGDTIKLNNKPYASSFLNRLTARRPMSSGDSKIENSGSTFDSLISRKNLPGGLSDSPSFYSRTFSSHLGDTRASTSGTTTLRPRSVFDIKESDISDDEGQFSSSPNGYYSSQGYSTRSRLLSTDYRAKSEDKKVWHGSYLISKVIMGLGILFFVAVGVTYFYIKKDAITSVSVETDSDVYPFCNPDNLIIPCVDSSKLEATRRLLNPLYQELTKRRVRELCKTEAGPPSVMSHVEMYHWILGNEKTKDIPSIDVNLKNLKVLVLSNPHWGLTVVPEKSEGLTREDVIDVKELVSSGGLTASDPSLPFGCYIRTKLTEIFYAVLLVVGGLTVLYGGSHFISWYLSKRQNNDKEVYAMVEKILDFLATHHRDSPHGYVAVNHVRDQLIAPPDRKQLSWVWEEAVKFIEQSESRVRCERQQVAGEQCHVWRWLGPSPRSGVLVKGSPSTFPVRGNKVWQGQAFEMIDGSPNHLDISPTPCLKLRHMFNPDIEYGEEWVTKVKDAILEKCEGIPILHIYVDEKSREGCVYLKCESQEDAGRAYRKLHGSWFDNDLVTVKYLRLERYYQRFHEAAHAMTPLQPSNNRKLSMQDFHLSLDKN